MCSVPVTHKFPPRDDICPNCLRTLATRGSLQPHTHSEQGACSPYRKIRAWLRSASCGLRIAVWKGQWIVVGRHSSAACTGFLERYGPPLAAQTTRYSKRIRCPDLSARTPAHSRGCWDACQAGSGGNAVWDALSSQPDVICSDCRAQQGPVQLVSRQPYSCRCIGSPLLGTKEKILGSAYFLRMAVSSGRECRSN